MKNEVSINQSHEISSFTTQLFLIVLMVAALGLIGCTATRMEAMIPNSIDLSKQFPYSVRVGYEGDSIRSKHSVDPDSARYFGSSDATQVNADTFMKSVVESITRSKLFREVLTEGDGDFRLDINIISEIKPQPGLQMSSTLVASWKLTRTADQEVVFDEIIEQTSKATPGSIVGVRTAVEGSVRENIKKAIESLSHIDL